MKEQFGLDPIKVTGFLKGFALFLPLFPSIFLTPNHWL
jgi:hypothetical protein